MQNKNANLELIKERLNILDIVSTYIKLEKAGNQFRAKCPFHNEKSPSFYVSTGRGTYHCFGCSEHGDIFGFIMKIEGINFKDALKLLADKANVSLSNFKKEETSNLIDILELSTLFFEQNFSKNSEAKKYMLGRGVTDESLSKFRIGFAPNDWRQLYNFLKGKGFSDDEIVSAGVCIKHEKGLYDRFRSRIIFPIMNPSGKVVAFTGRIIGPDEGKDGVAKYVNSPETTMYHKSSILFGYNFARQELAKLKKVLVVEGQMDVVMAHQAGNLNTVAISGTAFTPEHISIIKRFADSVILSLDTDKAGYAAMLKSAALALESDLEVEGLKLTDKDPADMIKTDIENWKKTASNVKPILTLITETILDKEKIKPKQIQLLRKDLFPLLRSVKSPLLKESFTKEIANVLNIDENIIRQETESIKTEIEIPYENKIKQNQRKVNNKNDILTIYAKGKIALLDFKDKILDKNLLEYLILEFNKLDNLDLKLIDIPDNIFSKEHILIESMLTGDDKQDSKNLLELVFLAFKVIIEEAILNAKNKIKKGEDLDTSLKIVQDLTKHFNNLKFKIDSQNLK